MIHDEDTLNGGELAQGRNLVDNIHVSVAHLISKRVFGHCDGDWVDSFAEIEGSVQRVLVIIAGACKGEWVESLGPASYLRGSWASQEQESDTNESNQGSYLGSARHLFLQLFIVF